MPVSDEGDSDQGHHHHQGNMVGTGNTRSMLTDPAPYVAAAFVTCAIAACFIFYLRRRTVNSTEENKKGDIEDDINTLNRSKRSSQIVIGYQTEEFEKETDMVENTEEGMTSPDAPSPNS